MELFRGGYEAVRGGEHPTQRDGNKSTRCDRGGNLPEYARSVNDRGCPAVVVRSSLRVE